MKSRKGRASTTGKAAHLCCRTCRSRHVKCDGRRPVCLECSSRGLTCRGYLSWDISPETVEAALATSNSSFASGASDPVDRQTSTQICRSPSTFLQHLLGATDEAVQAFDFFRYHLCAEYVRRGYGDGWANSSIAVALEEPALFYAIAALGSSDQAFIHSVHTTLARPRYDEQWNSALRLHGKALQALQGPMQAVVNGDSSLHPIVLGCLLFLIFEVTAGNHLDAIRHARIGRGILVERLESPASSRPSQSISSGSSPESSRANWSSGSDNFTPFTLRIDTSLAHGLPFLSLEDARSRLEVLIEAGQDMRDRLLSMVVMPLRSQLMSMDSRFCLQYTLSRSVAIDKSMRVALQDIMNGFGIWHKWFGRMYHAGNPSQDIFMLQIRFFFASFTLAMSRETDERKTDYFADQFSRTLECGERLLRQRPPALNLRAGEEVRIGPVSDSFMQMLGEVTNQTQTQRQTAGAIIGAEPFSGIGPSVPPIPTGEHAAGVFEVGILQAIFSIAAKCRSSGMRNKALELLEGAHRVETVHSSTALARYARQITYLEERDAHQASEDVRMEDDFYADEVPARSRFLDVVASAINPDGSFTLSCTRRASTNVYGFDLVEYACSETPVNARLVRVEGFGDAVGLVGETEPDTAL